MHEPERGGSTSLCARATEPRSGITSPSLHSSSALSAVAPSSPVSDCTLSAAMGYITSDVSVEIASDRLARVDVISMFFLLNDVLEGPDRFWVPYSFHYKKYYEMNCNNFNIITTTL